MGLYLPWQPVSVFLVLLFVLFVHLTNKFLLVVFFFLSYKLDDTRRWTEIK